MTQRFKNSDDVVGQFLPKVYTRRITLEDTKIVLNRPTRRRRGYFPAKSRRTKPGTAITVDYQIKDVLSEEGLGVITNNQRPDEDPNQIQDEILSALKVAMVLVSDNEVFENLFTLIRGFSQYAWRTSLEPDAPGLEQFLKQTISNINQGDRTAVLHINDARPDVLGFEVRNSQYQEYDIDNNLINIIPYNHTFKVDNEEFEDGDNLSLICFTYFDFNSLSLDEVSSDELKRLGYMTGDVTADIITRNARVESTAIVYKDAITNQPYYGPVHTMADGSVMTGLTHKSNSRPLLSMQVPLTKIQDFRSFERFKEVNYQPSVLQTFDDSIPSLDLIEKNYKDFFDVEDVIVDFDREERTANIEFTIDMRSVYEQTRYYDLVKSNPLRSNFANPGLLDILEITVYRRRVTKRPIGNNKLGAPSREQYEQVEEEDYIVATSGQNNSSSMGVHNRKITTQEDGDGKIMELGVSGFSGVVLRRFYVEDRQVADYLGTGAVFQYGVKIRIKDPTKDSFINQLELARVNLQNLDLYLQEASIPVFDSRMIRKPDPNRPISLDDVRDPPQYGESVQQGNYNTVTNVFTPEFIRSSRRKYSLRSYVENYIDLIELAFAKSEVNLYNFSNPTQGNSGQRGMVAEGFTATSTMDSIMSTESITMESASEKMYNMINPSNARPETIRSFIKTYQDLVMDLEDYFDIGYKYSLTTEGGGYRARGDNTITMQRWFSGMDENPDGTPTESDNFIEMEPLQRVYYRYWRTGDLQRGLGIPQITQAAYQFRLGLESTRFSTGSPIELQSSALTPLSLVIGDDEIFFKEDEMKEEQLLRKSKQKAESLKESEKEKKYYEQKRKGRASKRRPFKRRFKKRRAVLASPSDGKVINNFLQGLTAMSVGTTALSVNSMIGAVNLTPHFGVDTTEPNQPASYNGYFRFLSSMTEEMSAAASFRYSNSIEGLQSDRVLSDIDIEEYLSSNVATCGIIDNRPAGNEIVNNDNEFNRDEGLFPGLLDVIQRIPPISIPRLPQVTLPNFPVGGAIAAAARNFANGRASLPPTLPVLPPVTRAFPGPQVIPPVSIPSFPGVTSIRIKTGPVGADFTPPSVVTRSSTTTRTRRGRAGLPTTTRRSQRSSGQQASTRTSRAATPRLNVATATTNRSSSSRTSRSTTRANIPMFNVAGSNRRSSTRSNRNMGGPRIGGFGY